MFARKYMYEKLTKCPNFTWYFPENGRILRDICPKIIFFNENLGIYDERAPSHTPMLVVDTRDGNRVRSCT